MANTWSDPTIQLMAIIPYTISGIATTLYFVSRLVQEDEILKFYSLFFGSIFPWIIAVFFWKVLYHNWGEEDGVNTAKYIVWRPGHEHLASYYKHRRIPMSALYEYYIVGKFDWSASVENGDCLLILKNHRHHFVNYKITLTQVVWLAAQFLPSFLTGSGLGVGSSSGKSIKETEKEIREHYDKGNDVFCAILGESMLYTCAIFDDHLRFASDYYKGDYKKSSADGLLERAQCNKLHKICKDLDLRRGESFLDIGCGWGTLARFAKKFYGVESTGVTLSEQGKNFCDSASHASSVPTEIFCMDYRNIPPEKKFDKIASIEMAEHVGMANFRDPFLVNILNLLKTPQSKFFLQVSGMKQRAGWQDLAWGLFMAKYIFPGADASTPLHWYCKQCEMAGFEVVSVDTIGGHYSHTIHKWYDNWMSHKQEIILGKISPISEHSTGMHLFRLQEFFLAWSVIASAQGTASCFQLLLQPNTYEAPRMNARLTFNLTDREKLNQISSISTSLLKTE